MPSTAAVSRSSRPDCRSSPRFPRGSPGRRATGPPGRRCARTAGLPVAPDRSRVPSCWSPRRRRRRPAPSRDPLRSRVAPGRRVGPRAVVLGNMGDRPTAVRDGHRRTRERRPRPGRGRGKTLWRHVEEARSPPARPAQHHGGRGFRLVDRGSPRRPPPLVPKARSSWFDSPGRSIAFDGASPSARFSVPTPTVRTSARRGGPHFSLVLVQQLLERDSSTFPGLVADLKWSGLDTAFRRRTGLSFEAWLSIRTTGSTTTDRVRSRRGRDEGRPRARARPRS